MAFQCRPSVWDHELIIELGLPGYKRVTYCGSVGGNRLTAGDSSNPARFKQNLPRFRARIAEKARGILAQPNRLLLSMAICWA